MPKIKYEFVDRTSFEAEVNENFAAQYDHIKHRQDLIDRKETRRHQSLNMLTERGKEPCDKTLNIAEETERKETKSELYNALKILTDKQRVILISYAVHKHSFREIGDKLGINKETARGHYLAAVKKMSKLLKNVLW